MAIVFKNVRGREVLEFSGVRIVHRNFRGEQKEFNRAGARGFSIVLNQEEAEELIARGYNVRVRPARENPDENFSFLPVTVNYANLPPRIYRVTGEKMTLLKEATVGVLDTSDIINVDLTVNARHWDINGKQGIKAYVNEMYVEVEESVFAKKYADRELIVDVIEH